MARAVLHIGTHKTGTTAVQNALAHNRRLLWRHRIVYPEIGQGQPAHHGLAAKWNPSLVGFEPRGGAEAAWQSLARDHARGDATLLLSSEELSRVHGPGAVDLAFVRDALSGFERIDVVCVLREQVSFIQSAYLQISKNLPAYAVPGRPYPSWSRFLAAALAKGLVTGLTLDHEVLYDALVGVFGADHVHMVPYADAVTHPQGAVGVVLERVGGAPDASTLSLPDGGRANVTGDPLSVWVAAQISAPRRPPDALVAAVREIVAARYGPRTTLYTSAEIRAVRERFGPANERLAARLPGFALPWTSFEGTAKRGRLDSAFWIEVARRLHAA